MNQTYRARWIAQDGEVVRDDRFQFDAAAHENAPFVKPESRAILAIDAPYFVLSELQAHVGGHIEVALVAENIVAVVNEDGFGLALAPVPSPLLDRIWDEYGSPGSPHLIFGPVVLVERGWTHEVLG